MANSEVSSLAARLGGFGLQVRSRLAQVVVVQLFNEGQIGGFREHRLFLKDGEDTHRLKTDQMIISSAQVSKMLTFANN
jgi:hypothetical protein